MKNKNKRKSTKWEKRNKYTLHLASLLRVESSSCPPLFVVSRHYKP